MPDGMAKTLDMTGDCATLSGSTRRLHMFLPIHHRPYWLADYVTRKLLSGRPVNGFVLWLIRMGV
jgi:hypothetical protein